MLLAVPSTRFCIIIFLETIINCNIEYFFRELSIQI